MTMLQQLKEQIEATRRELDNLLKTAYSNSECYELSVRLDRLIERYIEMTETSGAL